MIPCFGLPSLRTPWLFYVILERISNKEWDLGMVFGSRVVSFYRSNSLERLRLAVLVLGITHEYLL